MCSFTTKGIESNIVQGIFFLYTMGFRKITSEFEIREQETINVMFVANATANSATINVLNTMYVIVYGHSENELLQMIWRMTIVVMHWK